MTLQPILIHALVAAGVLALVHVAASHLGFLHVRPRSLWLSMGGGIAVAYVFVHLLPELQEHQRVLAQATEDWRGNLQRHAYLVALLGLVIFHGLESQTQRDRRRRSVAHGDDDAGPGTFWLSMASFAVYNTLIGYLLVDQARSGASDVYTFSLAMGLHFLVNDVGLRAHHRHRYRRVGRWVLAMAVLVGALAGIALVLPASLVAVVVAFLSGGIVLNVLKEELPAERESCFAAFAGGAAAYAALLLARG